MHYWRELDRAEKEHELSLLESRETLGEIWRQYLRLIFTGIEWSSGTHCYKTLWKWSALSLNGLCSHKNVLPWLHWRGESSEYFLAFDLEAGENLLVLHGEGGSSEKVTPSLPVADACSQHLSQPLDGPVWQFQQHGSHCAWHGCSFSRASGCQGGKEYVHNVNAEVLNSWLLSPAATECFSPQCQSILMLI